MWLGSGWSRLRLGRWAGLRMRVRSPASGHTDGMLLARTVGLGELLIILVIVGAVVMVGLVALRNRTGGPGGDA